jgi:hypothetical protein
MSVQSKLFANSTYAALTAASAGYVTVELTDTTDLTGHGTGSRHILVNKYWRYYRVQCITDNNCATTDSLIIGKVIFKFYEK